MHECADCREQRQTSKKQQSPCLFSSHVCWVGSEFTLPNLLEVRKCLVVRLNLCWAAEFTLHFRSSKDSKCVDGSFRSRKVAGKINTNTPLQRTYENGIGACDALDATVQGYKNTWSSHDKKESSGEKLS